MRAPFYPVEQTFAPLTASATPLLCAESAPRAFGDVAVDDE